MTVKRRYNKQEFARRGDAIYDRKVRPYLSAADDGKFVAVDIDRGGRSGNHNHRPVQRDRVAEGREGAKDAVAANQRGLDMFAARQIDHERDHAAMRQVGALQNLPDFDKHEILGQIDAPQMRAYPLEIIRRQCR